MATGLREAIVGVLLLGAGTICAQVPPLALREAESLLSEGRPNEAIGKLEQLKLTPESASWQERMAILEARALIESGEVEQVLARLEGAESAELRLVRADALARLGRSLEAVGALHELALDADSGISGAKAQNSVFDHYWDDDEYEQFLNFREELSGAGIPVLGPRHVQAGYILLRQTHNTEAARAAFAEAVEDVNAKPEAEAALEWIDVLDLAASQYATEISVQDSMRAWVHQTQGGIVRPINSNLTALRTIRYAEAIHAEKPETALRLVKAVAREPLFADRAARARFLEDIWSGVQSGEAGARWAKEQEVTAHVRKALEANRRKEFYAALTAIDAALDTYPDSLQVPDAYLRRAYILLNADRDADARMAFEQCLIHNAYLGVEHPLNLEAAARLKNIAHADFYGLATSIWDDPSTEMANASKLDIVREALTTWSTTAPVDSADHWMITLEEGGVLFEEARMLGTPSAWELTREYLKRTLIDVPEAPLELRAIADLMLLETFYWEERYRDVVGQYEPMWSSYPENWKVLGSATVYTAFALRFMGKNDEASRLMARIPERIPSDAPYFPTMNYHLYAMYDEATRAKYGGEMEVYDRIRDMARRRFPNHPMHDLYW
ncbi:MAG: hypothetical protein PWP23_268 [Candidatus Sumerlaeota bacterium]|nr:hypothetical protein [Candidatus Sumerlaeota bacterium]